VRVRRAPSTDGHTRHRIITVTFIILFKYIPKIKIKRLISINLKEFKRVF